MEFLVEHEPGGAPVVHLTFEPDETLTVVSDALALADNALTTPTDHTASEVDGTIWLHGTTDERRSLLEAHGMTSSRTLLQMRRPLPAEASTITTRAFTDTDIADFVAVNNRAFDWHPEQSGLTAEKVRAQMDEPWFRADGFRLHHIDGALAGFCWTKVHEEPERLGEIYVIAVDPAYHGRGLGREMTLAGLDWLSDHGLTTGMLYVESDNEAAVATYHKIGFTVHRRDTMWTRGEV